MSKKKILFIILSLGGGGAERVLVTLLRHLDRTRFQPVLVMFDSKNDYKEDLPEDVKIVTFAGLGEIGIIENIRLIMYILRMLKIERPDVICSIMHYTNNLAAVASILSGSRTPLIFTHHGNLSHWYRPGRLKSLRLVKWIQKTFINPKAASIICVSSGIKEDLIQQWGVEGAKAEVIYNPFDTERISTLAGDDAGHPWFKEGKPVIVACGRLSPVKNYPLLLKAIAIALKDSPDLRLIILGQGELKNELAAYVEELGISDRVAFLGFQKNPFKFIARAKALVLSSVTEGFPMVLVEAMACGTPVISTSCPSGPDEIITDGVNGLLVPVNDEKALANAILRLMNDEPLRKQLAEAGRVRAEDFRADKITAEYEEAFDKILRHGMKDIR